MILRSPRSPEFNFFDQMLRYLEGRPSASVNHVYGDTSKKGDMVSIVKSLSEAQIEELAKHYAGLEFVPAKQSFDQIKNYLNIIFHQLNSTFRWATSV